MIHLVWSVWVFLTPAFSGGAYGYSARWAWLTLASYPTLRAGSKGKAVEALQCLLQERGLKKSVTGEVGSGTVSGINAYRASKGWSRNGVVPMTMTSSSVKPFV